MGDVGITRPASVVKDDSDVRYERPLIYRFSESDDVLSEQRTVMIASEWNAAIAREYLKTEMLMSVRG